MPEVGNGEPHHRDTVEPCRYQYGTRAIAADGTAADIDYFSVLADEWPPVPRCSPVWAPRQTAHGVRIEQRPMTPFTRRSH